MKSTNDRVGFIEKVGYGLGDTASNFYFQMFMIYLTFYYTDIFGISPAAVGTMLLVTRIWDTFNDPLMGIIADRTRTKWGKFRPYLIWMVIPFAVIGVFTFTTPDISYNGKIIYAYITYTLMMMAYTAINIPYSALMGVISPNSLVRTSLSSYRFVLAMVGTFIVQGATLPMVKFFGQGDQQKGFQMAMVVYAIAAIILFVITFATTKERVQPPKEQKSNLKEDLKDLLANKPWLILFVIGIFTLSNISIRSASIVYYFKYYVGNEDLSSLFMVLGTAGVIVGVMLTEPLSKRFGKRNLYMFLMGLTAILTAAFYLVPKEQIVAVFALHIIISTVMGPTAPLIWAMYADTADYSEWKSGRRATGLVFSAATFAQKFGWTIGGAIGGWLLAYYGFKANVEQTAETQNGIRLMISIIPAIGALLSTLTVRFYKLDDQLMKTIEIELKERKENE